MLNSQRTCMQRFPGQKRDGGTAACCGWLVSYRRLSADCLPSRRLTGWRWRAAESAGPDGYRIDCSVRQIQWRPNIVMCVVYSVY